MGANSYVCGSYRGKTGRGGGLFAPPPIMNRVNEVDIKIIVLSDKRSYGNKNFNEYCTCLSVISLDSIFVNSDKEY